MFLGLILIFSQTVQHHPHINGVKTIKNRLAELLLLFFTEKIHNITETLHHLSLKAHGTTLIFRDKKTGFAKRRCSNKKINCIRKKITAAISSCF